MQYIHINDGLKFLHLCVNSSWKFFIYLSKVSLVVGWWLMSMCSNFKFILNYEYVHVGIHCDCFQWPKFILYIQYVQFASFKMIFFFFSISANTRDLVSQMRIHFIFSYLIHIKLRRLTDSFCINQWKDLRFVGEIKFSRIFEYSSWRIFFLNA